MKQKATLLIKNLEKIYTMKEIQGKDLILTHAYIAIRHHVIMECGCGDFSNFIDKDTRIIDGLNHIAIPSFIEPYADMTVQKDLLEQHEFFMRYRNKGTLNIHVVAGSVSEQLCNTYEYGVIPTRNLGKDYPLIHVPAQMRKANFIASPLFCISCNDKQFFMQNQMLAAQMLAMKEDIKANTLLKALTIYPAKMLNLPNQGILEKGRQADILIVAAKDIHTFFYTMDQDRIAHMIHRGVRIYPNLLV